MSVLKFYNDVHINNKSVFLGIGSKGHTCLF